MTETDLRPAPTGGPTPLSPGGMDRLARALDALRVLGPQPAHPDQGPAGEHTFGRFLLRDVLGKGRFGIVFLAEDPEARRLVALKLPQPGILFDPALAERFRRDAEAAGPLDHPGIVAVLEAGSVGAVPYLAMPHVPGPTLAAWL